MQESYPDAEHLGRDLPVVIEAAEHTAFLRKSGFLSRWGPLGDVPLGIVDLIAIRQVNDLLRIKRLVVERHYRLVGDDVVDELGPHRTGKAEIARLDRRRTIRKNARPRILRVSLQINRNVDLSIANELGDFLIALSADIVKLIKRRDEPLAHIALVIHTE